MSGFIGKTETTESIPGDIEGLRKNFAGFLAGQGFTGLNTGSPDIAPYQDLFKQQNAQNFAQANEASGNLTGSGHANTLGKAAARGNVEQGAFLASLLEQSKQQNASRLAQVLLPFLTQGVGPPQQTYQPGFLDYAAQAGTSLAQGGAFNSAFGGTKRGT